MNDRLVFNFFLVKNYFIQFTGSSYYWASQGSETKPCYFVDAGFLRNIIKNKLSVSATVKNVLNNKTVNFINVSDFQYSVNAYDVLPRIILFGLKYHF